MKTILTMFAILLMAAALAGCESLPSDETMSSGGHNHAGMSM